MRKDIAMRLETIIRVFKEYARQEYVGVYVAELEKTSPSIPEIVFSLHKLHEYCKHKDDWNDEKIELQSLIDDINILNQCEADKEKAEEPFNKFWVSFRHWLYSELPSKGWLYSAHVGYDNWNQGTYYLDISFDSLFRTHLGIPYENQFDDENHCQFANIKILIELMYKELIKVEFRYVFTVQINKIFSRFSLPYELKNGKLIKKGYKSTERNSKIINFQMLESKIQWSEDKILGSEILDKHTALNYITDALQYLLSLINALETPELHTKNIKQRCAFLISNDENSKSYSVVLKEISEIQTIANEYFDIRHNEYLSQASKTTREPLRDAAFIEYLYNRIYGLLYFLKNKYLQFQVK